MNFGPLAAEIGPVVWGTPANFNRFRVLAALLHGTVVVGVSQTLRRWTESATYIRQGGQPSRWALAHISSFVSDLNSKFLLSRSVYVDIYMQDVSLFNSDI